MSSMRSWLLVIRIVKIYPKMKEFLWVHADDYGGGQRHECPSALQVPATSSNICQLRCASSHSHGQWYGHRGRLRWSLQLQTSTSLHDSDQCCWSEPLLHLHLDSRIWLHRSLLLLQLVIFIVYAVMQSKDGIPTTANSGAPLYSPLIYNPRRRYEAWRYLTYMFIHQGWVTLQNQSLAISYWICFLTVVVFQVHPHHLQPHLPAVDRFASRDGSQMVASRHCLLSWCDCW